MKEQEMLISEKSAFPVFDQDGHTRAGAGITKREYFASAALQALVTGADPAFFASSPQAKEKILDACHAALEVADAMCEILEEQAIASE